MESPHPAACAEIGERNGTMPGLRGRQHHRDRLAEAMREEISSMIQGELSDPRISFAYVSEVILNPGGKSAEVYIAVDGGADEENATLEALGAAQGFIHHELIERLGIRHVPDIGFHLDRSERLKARIDELLGRSKKHQKTASEKQ